MQKPTAVIAAVVAVSIPVVIATSSQAADVPATSPYAPQTTPAATTPAATTPAPTTPKPTTPAAAPAAPAPAPGVVLTGLQASVKARLTTFSYSDVLAGKATVTFATPGAGTYVVSLAYRKPAKKYRSVAKGAITGVKTGGTTVDVLLKPNSYAPSTVRYAKHQKQVKVQVTYLYEVGNRTVQTTESLLLAK